MGENTNSCVACGYPFIESGGTWCPRCGKIQGDFPVFVKKDDPIEASSMEDYGLCLHVGPRSYRPFDAYSGIRIVVIPEDADPIEFARKYSKNYEKHKKRRIRETIGSLAKSTLEDDLEE